jgi:hypothetical protein
MVMRQACAYCAQRLWLGAALLYWLSEFGVQVLQQRHSVMPAMAVGGWLQWMEDSKLVASSPNYPKDKVGVITARWSRGSLAVRLCVHITVVHAVVQHCMVLVLDICVAS